MPPLRIYSGGFRDTRKSFPSIKITCFEKWLPDRLLYATIFKRFLDIVRIKICHLKGENKWEIPRVNFTHDN